jgi:hypothetical protein
MHFSKIYDPRFMGVLLHYLKTQVNIDEWNAQDLIIAIHCDAKAHFNEDLEREYGDLNKIDRLVVDNSKVFEIGVPLERISVLSDQDDVKGNTANGIAKKLNSICTSMRISLKRFEEIQLCYNDAYSHCGIRSVIHNPRPMIYILKPRANQQDAMWNIIDYMRNKEPRAETEEKGDLDPWFA